jgi:hypothetical protein
MSTHPGERYTVEVSLMAEPCLWCWEIRDTACGEVLESSWTCDWTAYDSAETARMAGYRRLAQHTRLIRAESMSARGAPM